MEDVDERVVTMPPIDPARLELGRRMRLCAALFHDGVKSRAHGDEAHCLARMRECSASEKRGMRLRKPEPAEHKIAYGE